MNPKFSIIVPVYNVAPYLQECLDSVLFQSCGDWECICVDDGSTDSSGDILDAYAKRDGRFKVVHQANGGVSCARNAGLDRASGEWIVFVDPDDWLELNMLEMLLHEIASRCVDIIIFKYREDVAESSRRCGDIAASMAHEFDCDDFLRRQFSLGLGGHAALLLNKAYRREVIERKHLRFVTGLKYYEDLIFSYEALASSGKLYIMANFSPYHVRNRAGSAVSVMKPSDHLCALTLVQGLSEFAARNNTPSLNSTIVSYVWGLVFRMKSSPELVDKVLRSPAFCDVGLSLARYESATPRMRLFMTLLYWSPVCLKKVLIRVL